MADFEFDIKATGPGGESTTTVKVNYVKAPPVITYPTPYSVEQGSDFSLTPTSSGGQITGYALKSGTLPTGVTLDADTGVVSGTTSEDDLGSFTVTATGPGGDGDSNLVDWTVTPLPAASDYPVFDFDGGQYYAHFRAQVGSAATMTPVIDAISGDILNFDVIAGTDPVPDGMTIDATTGVLSFTPTAKDTTGKTVKVRGTNSLGTREVTVWWAAHSDTGAKGGGYRQDPLTVYEGQAFIALPHINKNTAAPTSRTLASGVLPSWLEFVPESGAFRTKGAEVMAATPYVVDVTGADGVTQQTLTIEVVAKTEPSPGDSLRPSFLPAIPAEIGKSPNATTTANAGKKAVTPTTRGSVITIGSGGSLPSNAKVVCSSGNTTYRLLEDMHVPSAAFQVKASGITIDLNGFTIYWHEGLPEDYWSDGFNKCKAIYSTSYNLSDVEVVNGDIIEGGGADDRFWKRGRSGGGLNAIHWENSVTDCRFAGLRIVKHGEYASVIKTAGGFVLEDCTLWDLGTFIAERQSGVNVASSSMTARRNLLIDFPHRGLYMSNSGCVVEDNEIQHDSFATNAMAIATYGKSNHTVERNNVYSYGEHPQCFAIHSDDAGGSLFADNWGEAKSTRPSLEYTGDVNYASAFNDRWGGRTESNEIRDNVLVGWGEAGSVPYLAGTLDAGAKGLWVASGKAWLREWFHGNVICGYDIGDGQSAGKFVSAVTGGISGNEENHKACVISENTLISNRFCVSCPDNYGNGRGPIRWVANTFKKSADVAGTAFATVQGGGEGIYTLRSVQISNVYEAPASRDDLSIAWAGGGYTQYVYQGWKLTVTVTDGGVPVEGATVQISAAGVTMPETMTYVDYGTTDVNGEVVLEAWERWFDSSGTPIAIGDLTVTATKDAKTGSSLKTVTSDDSVSVAIS